MRDVQEASASQASASSKDAYLAAGSAIGAIGSALTAAFSALCCVGPAVLAVIGASGAVAAASLGPYRPYLLGSSAVLLGYGFWRSYRPRLSTEGLTCRISTGRKVRTTLFIALGVTAVSAVLPLFAH
jgi:mercuric ion transport protein